MVGFIVWPDGQLLPVGDRPPIPAPACRPPSTSFLSLAPVSPTPCSVLSAAFETRSGEKNDSNFTCIYLFVITSAWSIKCKIPINESLQVNKIASQLIQ